MSLTPEQRKQIDAIFSDWIQIVDKQNPFTIETFPYSTGVIGILTKPHCVPCTAINCCWFKNEKGKKPEEFNYKDIIIKEGDKGLYHPHCHCKKYAINTPELEDIELIIPEGKVDWLINNKSKWIIAMGYDDVNEFLNVLYNLTKEAFENGAYACVLHNKFGFKINVDINIPGKGEKSGKIYPLKTAYMIFPNGKLKNNTLLGGWRE